MRKLIVFTILLQVFLVAGQVYAFQEDGCGGDCRDCHKMSKDDARKALTGFTPKPPEIVDVQLSEVPGMWTVIVQDKGKKIPVYLDFSGKYMFNGKIIKLENKLNLSMEKFISLNKIDTSIISIDDAVVIGDPKAKIKIIVFDDPECAYCKKLHPQMKKVVADNKNIAFFIKLFPLQKLHPQAYAKAKAIQCARSAQMLEDSLFGKAVPPALCDTDQIDKNIALAGKLGITSTPTLIFPDGRVIPGATTAEKILERLAE